MNLAMIKVMNLVNEDYALFSPDTTIEHALAMCYCEDIGMLSWYLYACYTGREVTAQSTLPFIYGKYSVGLGDYAVSIKGV